MRYVKDGKMNELALFAGAGGGILGGHLLGWRTVCAVEWEPYPASVLVARQNDGLLAPFPVWDDVRTFDGRPWRGIVDVVSGGFPCQDISAAGKGLGIEGECSGLWKEMARIIGEVRPRFAFVENSPMLTTRGLGTVLADLAALGFDAEWGLLSGRHLPNSRIIRERIWILACSDGSRRDTCRRNESEEKRKILEFEGLVSHKNGWNGWNASTEEKCKFLGMADGLAGELDEIKTAGNGQVPALAATAFNLLHERLMK
jgi:DNA (cytosine-5)-methyltransferase 1